MGKSTRFLKEEAQTDMFTKATGDSLNTKTMRDREFVNRFCAFQIFGVQHYKGDMDDFLASALKKMNLMENGDLQELSKQFNTGLSNNYLLFGQNAFRKHKKGQQKRGVLNASLWDVMSSGLAEFEGSYVKSNASFLREKFYALLRDDDFIDSITRSTNGSKQVKTRFEMVQDQITDRVQFWVLWERNLIYEV